MNVMSRIVVGLALLGMVLMTTAPASLARPTSQFKVMIFPLECSIDLLNTGVNVLTQITPENCLDPGIEKDTIHNQPPPLTYGRTESGGSPGAVGAVMPLLHASLMAPIPKNIDKAAPSRLDSAATEHTHAHAQSSSSLAMNAVIIGGLLTSVIGLVVAWRQYGYKVIRR